MPIAKPSRKRIIQGLPAFGETYTGPIESRRETEAERLNRQGRARLEKAAPGYTKAIHKAKLKADAGEYWKAPLSERAKRHIIRKAASPFPTVFGTLGSLVGQEERGRGFGHKLAFQTEKRVVGGTERQLAAEREYADIEKIYQDSPDARLLRQTERQATKLEGEKALARETGKIRAHTIARLRAEQEVRRRRRYSQLVSNPFAAFGQTQFGAGRSYSPGWMASPSPSIPIRRAPESRPQPRRTPSYTWAGADVLGMGSSRPAIRKNGRPKPRTGLSGLDAFTRALNFG